MQICNNLCEGGGRRMKKIKVFFVLLFALGLINLSCKNNVEELLDGKESNKVYLIVSCNSNARTIQPSYNLESLTDFELLNNSDSKIAEAKSYKELSKLVIEVGYIPEGSSNQSFTLKAKDKETSFSAYSQVNLHSGINNISFDLSPVKNSGKGNIELTFSINKSLGVKGVKAGLYSIDRFKYGKSIEGFESENLDLVIEDNVITAKYNKTSVSNGYYLFKAEFYADLDCKIFINNYENIVEVITGSTTDSVINISELNKLYSITYVLNGGEFIEGFSIPSIFTRFSNLELPTYANIIKEGAFFAGWYLNDDFSGNKLLSTASLDDDIVLYAKWNSIIELTPENLLTTDFANVDDIRKIVITGNFSNILEELAGKIKSITSAEIILDMSNMTGVTEFPDSLFENCTTLNTVVIPNTVNIIGSYVFKGCIALESVSFGSEIEEVGYGAFAGCPLFESVYYTGTLADWAKTIFKTKIIGRYQSDWITGNPCFYGASLYINGEKITDKITIPDGIDRIGEGAFLGFKQLTSVTIPKSVTEIDEYAFKTCYSVERVYYNGTISEWLTIKFDDHPCSNSDLYINGEKLTEIKASDFPTNLTRIGDSAFAGCKSLTSVVIGNCIETIGNDAFYGCVSLNNVVIKDGVLEIGGSAFFDCTSLKSIEIPVSVKAIYSVAFGSSYPYSTYITNYGSIESVYYKGTLADWMKIHFSDLYMYNVSGENWYTSNPCNGGGDLYINNEKLTEINEGDIPEDITEILPGCFFGLNLTSVAIGNNIKSIGDGAFKNTKLKKLSIGDGVTSIGKHAFSGNPYLDIFFTGTDEQWCTRKWLIETEYNLYIDEQKITDITIPNEVTDIGKAFAYCKSVINIAISSGVTEIKGKAFEKCENLESVTILNGVTKIGEYAFQGCKNLESVTIPNSIIKIGEYPFSECPKLARIDYKGTLWQWVSIDFSVVYGGIDIDFSMVYLNDCKLTDYTELIIPEGVTYIPSWACEGMTFLTSVSFPNSLTSINSRSFKDCSGLTDITIPANVKNIYEDAFSGCTGLSNITFIDSNDWYLHNRVVVDVTDSVNVINLLKSGELFYKWVY